MFDAHLARALCLAADCSYDPGCVKVRNLAFTIKEGPETVTAAIQGTNDALDAIRDASAILAPCILLPGFGCVHRGFAECLFALAPEIERRIPSGKRLVLAGHSLGAALAQLLAVYLDKRGHSIECVYGFGCPGIGDARWVNAYQAMSVPTYGLVHACDVVTQIPPWALHAEELVFMDRLGHIIPERMPAAFWPPRSWFGKSAKDHAIGEYLECLDKLTA